MKVEILKDKHNQQPVPTLWRGAFIEMVKAIMLNDMVMLNSTEGIRTVSNVLMQEIQGNINEYGCRLTDLNEKTWEYSACQWMVEYWDVLIDLNTVEEGLSDLSLFVRVFEKGKVFEFEVLSVHVQ